MWQKLMYMKCGENYSAEKHQKLKKRSKIKKWPKTENGQNQKNCQKSYTSPLNFSSNNLFFMLLAQQNPRYAMFGKIFPR